jgi:UDP-N-acetylglucosamine diphosphorylase/glucosamine-1-phosphate N-acetyltransferase
MNSDLPKVLFPLGGKALVHHVLDAALAAGMGRIVVIVGHRHELVVQELEGRPVEVVLQEPQLGTGHALQCAAPRFEGFTGDVAVLAGDAPLIRSSTLEGLMARHAESGAAVTILTAMLPDPKGYGRIVRDASGTVASIVEHKDASEAVREIREINSSIYAFRWPFLARALPRLRSENKQAELYLTDTVKMAFEEGHRVEGVMVDDFREIAGINDRQQLEEAERALRDRRDA